MQIWSSVSYYIKHTMYSCMAWLGRPCLIIDVQNQRMYWCQKGLCQIFEVSTGKNGTGETMDSGMTPRGWLRINSKIGSGQAVDTIFKGRKPVGRYDPSLGDHDPILSRILWLEGMQPHNSCTKDRYIYIHGALESPDFGVVPLSEGCVRMQMQDCLTLFDQVHTGCLVYIHDDDNLLPWQASWSRILLSKLCMSERLDNSHA